MKKFILIPFLLCFVFLVPSREIAFAEGRIAWNPEGKPICEAPLTQQNIRMVPDGSGGAIIVWEDYRNSITAPDIYAQKINENGIPQWTTYGVAVCTYTYRQERPVIVSDGYGGAIIAWEDYRGGFPNIYAVRISSDGNTPATWQDNGLALKSSSTDKQSFPDIVSDGSGGAIVVWQEDNSSQYSIYAHGIDGNGINMWLPASVVVSTGPGRKECPKIINDGTGNVIVTWQDYFSGTYDIYAHRMAISSGTKDLSWSPNGNPISVVATSDQKGPEIVPDGSGGAIITWTDCRNDTGDIYSQRISSTGVRMWDIDGNFDGIPICVGINIQHKPVIINALLNGATTGAIIAWEDMRSGDIDIYAVRIDSYPPSFEPGDEVLIAGGYGNQKSSRMVGNDDEGGIIAWLEDRTTTKDQIFAQKRGNMGEKMWTSPSEVSVCEATAIKEHCMISDGSGGVIIAWVAQGTASDYNIYAQRVIGDAAQLPSAWISGWVVRFSNGQGITGVEVEALKDDKSFSNDTTLNGYYEITGLQSGTTYQVRATWMVNDIVSSVSMEATAPSNLLFFTLEIDYYLGTIVGSVSGVKKRYITGLSCPQSKKISGSRIQKILSPGNGIAFVELEQRDKVIARVPVETDGSYSIPNLLPGRFIARAYNGTIYSKPRTVNLKEGETLKVNFVFGIMPGETVFNYPNPAKSGSTTIRYYCGYSDPEGEIKIYDISGELVRKVGDSEIDGADAPIYKFVWDCKNSSGTEVASGVYIYVVEVEDRTNAENKKVVKRLAVVR